MKKNIYSSIFFCALFLTSITNTYAQSTMSSELLQKMQSYIVCVNRLSDRSFQSRNRYFSWAGDKDKIVSNPRVIYGLYEIYDTSDCVNGVERANAADPNLPDVEAAGADYVIAVISLESILKITHTYYDQEDYKDDKMVKGKELHPQLLTAFANFEKADTTLRGYIDVFNDKRQLAQLIELEKAEGRSAAFLTEFMMSKAKVVVRLEMVEDMQKIDLTELTTALGEFQEAVQELDAYANANKDQGISSSMINSSKSVLKSAKRLMRRVRDKTGYTDSERQVLNGPGGWMVDGSRPELVKYYNELIAHYNRR